MPATHRIVDIVESSELEVSFVRRGSNHLAKVFLKKSADEPAPSLEITEMLKSVALAKAMSDAATAAYLATLTKEEDLDAFLEKQDSWQAQVDAWVEKSGWKPPEKGDDKKDVKKDEPANAGKSEADIQKEALEKAAADNPLVAALLKSVETLSTSVETLKGEVEKGKLDGAESAVIAKAKSEFGKSPLGTEKVAKILKGIASIDKGVAEEIEALIKSHAELSEKVSGNLGLVTLQRDANSATAKLTKMATDMAAAEKISFEEAIAKISDDPANDELIQKADAEEAGALRAA